ncbi:Hypothetical protein Tpal_464 [Trichococcus palustris]|uniref:HTH cro/C1-type domain-containing protein n=1 Tax=Trichococcus palustris TaxID=140314 RepID=A0A143Y8J5_9LACT|nr:DUF739 family protein [Trichococcus palustris]CZQ83589.1 Hypothetical protein Tpal_464 [Trichococcus palustris]SFK70162.1 Protein of unknown function [Trichococcus palustris]
MSFEYNKLRGRIREKFATQEEFAIALGMSTVALSGKLNGHTFFTQPQIKKACELLLIEPNEVSEYFFVKKVQKTELK